MLEFLDTVANDPDLRQLWKTFLNEKSEEDREHALLVFTDRLEEVGWRDEARCIRLEVTQPTQHTTVPRLQLPDSMYMGQLSQVPAYRYYYDLTRATFQKLGIENAAYFVFSSSYPVAQMYYRYGLPHTLEFNATDFSSVFPFLQSFLHLMPIRELRFDVRRLLRTNGQVQIEFNDRRRHLALRVYAPRLTTNIFEHTCIAIYTMCQLPEQPAARSTESALDRLPASAINAATLWLSAALGVTITDTSNAVSTQADRDDLCPVYLDTATSFRNRFNMLNR